MSAATPQNFSNHRRFDPIVHFFVLPVFVATLIVTIVHLVRRPGLHSALLVVVALAALIAVFKIRLYALKVQDRIIRLEERLRLSNLLDPALRPRIPELSEDQLVGLRFASDAELPALAAHALNEKLSRDEIKKSIHNWRPDHWRV